MTIPKEECLVPPTTRASNVAKPAIIIATAVITGVVSFIGAIVALQGGNFWPWFWAMVGLYGIELLYAGIAAVIHHRSPAERKKREFYKHRQAARTPS